jgi:hypothetical protein
MVNIFKIYKINIMEELRNGIGFINHKQDITNKNSQENLKYDK